MKLLPLLLLSNRCGGFQRCVQKVKHTGTAPFSPRWRGGWGARGRKYLQQLDSDCVNQMTPFRVNNSFCEGSHVLTMAVYSLRVPIPSSEGYDIFQIILWLLIILQLRFLHEQDERQTYSQDF